VSRIYRQRKSPRLQGYDYSTQGLYFVTICTHERVHLFGNIRDGETVLSEAGQVAEVELEQVATYWSGMVELDCFVVMPNHVHMIVVITGQEMDVQEQQQTEERQTDGQRSEAQQTDAPQTDAQKRVPTLGRIVNGYKGGTTRLMRQRLNEPEMVVWQGRYHDHIIRHDHDLNRIREYVAHNPARWVDDVFYQDRKDF
jgi:REP element-mobilizing transposase RayT